MRRLDRLRASLLAEHAESRAGVGLSSSSDLTALQLAALYDADTANALLDGGAVCDLHSACALGRATDVRRLGRAGGFGALAEHLTPMGFALVKSQPATVDALLEAGDDPNRALRRVGFFVWELEALRAGHGPWSPLHAACVHGYAAGAAGIVTALLEAGADRDAASPLGDRSIHLAATYGWMPVLEVLRAAGADMDSRTVPVADAVWRLSAPAAATRSSDLTPAMIAAREGRDEALRWLLAHGADANALDTLGSTALHVAARPWWGENPALAATLIEAGADPGIRDRAGRTPRDIAVAAGYLATTALFDSRRTRKRSPSR